MHCPFYFTHLVQFTALLGDLQHRSDVHIHYQDFGPRYVDFFSNLAQAKYVIHNHPELVCDIHWSTHSLGTVFEYYYYTDLSFRLKYLANLPDV